MQKHPTQHNTDVMPLPARSVGSGREAIEADIQTVIACPSTSFWLRNALQTALTRDAVDASHDAEHLAALLKRRADSLLQGQ